MNTNEILIKQCRKCKGTLKLYFTQHLGSWRISWSPYLTSETNKRHLVSPQMAAHIIANVFSPF